MKYYNSKEVSYSFDETINKVQEVLKEQGFGVLSDIDVQATLKKKIDVDFRKYRILGACNPPFAHQALTAEPNIGVLLPCNVVVQENEAGKVEVSMINPMDAMQSVNNPEMTAIAEKVTEKLDTALKNL